VRRCIWAWRIYTEAAIAAGKQLTKEQYFELRYEDLVAHPTDQADRILEFLQIEGAEAKNTFRVAVSNATETSVGRGSKEFTEEQLQVIFDEAGSLLGRLGYLR
jgi:hypothetical protein